MSIAVNSRAAAGAPWRPRSSTSCSDRPSAPPSAPSRTPSSRLAACATDVEAGQSLLDRALLAHEKGELTPADAAKVKLFCTELRGRVVDRCLQLHGGYGYILEYPIAGAYADARVTRIYAGSSEIMKTIIAKDIGL
ncbi:acyl-CoA dehydrogenase family protein [Janibacter limosus]|uniref:Uncharacterized protein n=1 Tax=Janibacter limosus TaxID=53458 RepID=A0AC61U851_9MICO|nr:acyl-CoA dehydrogenase family protein [Janibacter limosus]UUZ46226.1 acyl-CoA dehydrogenase family protein [Janibacter limosus]